MLAEIDIVTLSDEQYQSFWSLWKLRYFEQQKTAIVFAVAVFVGQTKTPIPKSYFIV